jgi:thiol:disulfide interchange protein DsbD
MHATGRLSPLPLIGLLGWLLVWVPVWVPCAPVLAGDDFLQPEEAFKVTTEADGADRLRVNWTIAEGYYLYKDKLRFTARTPGLELGTPILPAAAVKEDAYFGKMEVYRHQVGVRLPLTRSPGSGNTLDLEIVGQGCADAGLCYPPQRQRLAIELLPTAIAPAQQAVGPVTGAFQGQASAAPPSSAPVGERTPGIRDTLILPTGLRGEESIPTVEEAFQFQAEVAAPDRLQLTWDLAPGTFLYRDKIKLALEGSDGVRLGAYRLPPGEMEHDAVLPDGRIGEVAVYRGRVELTLPLLRTEAEPVKVTLVAGFQGCAEAGICYPPQTRRIALELPPAEQPVGYALRTLQTGTPAPTSNADVVVPPTDPPIDPLEPLEPPAEQDRIAAVLAGGNLPAVIGLFFGFGLLLAFTPCIFPMIPILSGIIAGHGTQITTRRAFILSLVYVLAMASTYTVTGVLAGLFGANLQAVFQNPWIIAVFALVFVLLALAMFGFFHLQLPAGLHHRLALLSHRQRGGTLLGVAVMGVLSALIVGPCVAPPLFGTLIYISQTGDAVLGGLALFALSLGIGTPLIAIGTSAGKLLPRAGAWMGAVNAFFGVILLGVAILLLERILPTAVAMVLWGLLLIGSAVYLGALTHLPAEASGWSKLWKGLGVCLLIYGGLMLVGAAAGSKDSLQPLRGIQIGGGADAGGHLNFQRIKTVADLDRELAAARAAGRPVMLDFYADWCVSCKEMEHDTFTDPRVARELSRFMVLQADVTANDAADQALMQGRYRLHGPPAMLFFSPAGEELRHLRLVGFTPATEFVQHLRRIGP